MSIKNVFSFSSIYENDNKKIELNVAKLSYYVEIF